MAAAQRKPFRIDDTFDAACVRVHAGMFADRVNVSAVTKMWPSSTGRGTSTTVVSFILRDSSNRRERRQRRSEARAAAFRARRRFGVAIQDARAAGEEYARELVAFAGLSVDAPPFFPRSFRVRWQCRGPRQFSGSEALRAWRQPWASRSWVYRRRRTLRVRCSGAGERAASLSGPGTRSCFSGGCERGVTLCGLGTRSFFSDGGERTATLRSTGTLLSFSGGGELCASVLSAGARSLCSGGGARAIVVSSGSVCWKRHR